VTYRATAPPTGSTSCVRPSEHRTALNTGTAPRASVWPTTIAVPDGTVARTETTVAPTGTSHTSIARNRSRKLTSILSYLSYFFISFHKKDGSRSFFLCFSPGFFFAVSQKSSAKKKFFLIF
jgi:hypothetical protein